MDVLVLMGLCIAALLVIAGIYIGKRSVLNDGSPITKIAPGAYQVGFVYQAGDNVSVGIETREEKEDRLFFCQFPAKDFEGEIRAGAKKLTAYKLVTGSGIFNKYKLE